MKTLMTAISLRKIKLVSKNKKPRTKRKEGKFRSKKADDNSDVEDVITAKSLC
jgi:hypothetical protein